MIGFKSVNILSLAAVCSNKTQMIGGSSFSVNWLKLSVAAAQYKHHSSYRNQTESSGKLTAARIWDESKTSGCFVAPFPLRWAFSSRRGDSQRDCDRFTTILLLLFPLKPVQQQLFAAANSHSHQRHIVKPVALVLSATETTTQDDLFPSLMVAAHSSCPGTIKTT